MVKSWWYLYGIMLRLDLSIVLFLTILVLTNRINILGAVALVIGQSGLCLMAIKARLPLLRTHRLLGMALVDALYEYMKAHIIALLLSFFLLVITYQLALISQGAAQLIAGSLISMYLLSVLSIYIMLRRSL